VLQVELPILPEQIIRYQLGQPLDFNPGERYAYSNFGYSLLGRIIEKVTGQPYDQYVQTEILKPLAESQIKRVADYEASVRKRNRDRATNNVPAAPVVSPQSVAISSAKSPCI
jgi:CubicO group peptidase (beta-lactamase class C family)